MNWNTELKQYDLLGKEVGSQPIATPEEVESYVEEASIDITDNIVDYVDGEVAALDSLIENERVQRIAAVDKKQDKLTAGNNIIIDEHNVISASGGGADVLVLDYSTTPNPEAIPQIKNAVDENRPMLVRELWGSGGDGRKLYRWYYFLEEQSSVYYFSTSSTTFNITISIEKATGKWTKASTSQLLTSNRKTSVNNYKTSNTDIPTTKAVYDFVSNATKDLATKSSVNEKQNKLTAGTGIELDDNRISCSFEPSGAEVLYDGLAAFTPSSETSMSIRKPNGDRIDIDCEKLTGKTLFVEFYARDWRDLGTISFGGNYFNVFGAGGAMISLTPFAVPDMGVVYGTISINLSYGGSLDELFVAYATSTEIAGSFGQIMMYMDSIRVRAL